MGTSKAMMEKVIYRQIPNRWPQKTTICITRYGKRHGFARFQSFLCLLNKYIAEKPLTITDPNMTRFLMKSGWSRRLSPVCFWEGRSGRLIVQKAPASTIDTLAKALIELSSLKVKLKLSAPDMVKKRMKPCWLRKKKLSALTSVTTFKFQPITAILIMINILAKAAIRWKVQSYTSDNTERLDVRATKKKLLTVDYVNAKLKGHQ